MRILILSRNSELYSTRSLFNAARRRNHFVRVVDHMHCDINLATGKSEVYLYGQKLSGYDAIVPRIGYTATKHGAAVIRQFEGMNILTTLPSDGLVKARDKLHCLQLLSREGIQVPPTLLLGNSYSIPHMTEVIEGYPKILKVMSGTHGLGVLKADDASSLESMLEAFYNLKQKVLIQQFIKESAGEDVRVFVVDGKVVASMVRKAQEGEFRSNMHRGATARTALLSEAERLCALKSARIMGLRIAGVDLLRSDKGPMVLEVNASPGLEGIETTTRVDVAKIIITYIERNIRK